MGKANGKSDWPVNRAGARLPAYRLGRPGD